MKKAFIIMTFSAMAAGCADNSIPKAQLPELDTSNPLLAEWDTPHQTPPFSEIELSDYEPAFDAAIACSRAEIDAIVGNPSKPTFGNTIVARIDRGEEILTALQEIAEAEDIRLASISALGATNDFTVGVYNVDEKQYHANDFKGNFEIVSLTGTVSTKDGRFYAHLHMSAGDERGQVFGGHLNRAVVSAVCEMVITVIDGVVDRRFSEEIGLNLFRF